MKTLTHPRQTLGIKIVVALFFLLIPFISNTQTKVFPEKDAIWNITYEYRPGHIEIGLSGDTVINEKQYSKLYQLYDGDLQINEMDEYVGAIRTEGKQVWIYPERSNVEGELLLYDFSLNKEDKFDIKFGASYSYFYVTDNLPPLRVLDVTEDELKRKHYIVENEYGIQDEWIEGIGSLRGPFFYSLALVVGEGPTYNSYKLVSMTQGDSLVYYNPEICGEPFCWFGVGLEDTQQTPSIALYPNPVKEILHIDLGDTPLPLRFELFDPQGRITYTQTLTNFHTTVTPPPHSKGLHHYRLTGSDGKTLQSGQLLLE